ncbi:MAG: transglycosylase SLT domain-containing protein [Burkholderiales bacterium]
MLQFFAFLALLVPALALGQITYQDGAFLAAKDAFEKRDPVKLARAAGDLRGHILEPYAEHYQLRLRIDAAAPDEVRTFLAKYPNSVIADQVRTDWLRALGKRQQWDLFFAEYPNQAGEDLELACYALEARGQYGKPADLADLRQAWLAPRDLPDGCVKVAEALMAEGKLTNRQLWERIRILIEAGRLGPAKRTAAYLPADERPDDKLLESLFANPHRYLEKPKFDLLTRLGRELAVLALVRYSRMDPTAAASHLEVRQSKLQPADLSYAWGQIAFQAARQHHPQALAWYASADANALADEQLAWRARAALREERWDEVRDAIERMPPLSRGDPVWVYWLGRAVVAQGDRAAGEALFSRIAGEHNFYGKLAAEELGMPLAIPGKGFTPSAAEVSEVAANAGLQRALALLRLDQRPEGVREWNAAIRGLDDQQLLAVAEFARRNEVWDRAINTAERTKGLHDFSLRFLSPYRDVFRNQAGAQGLDEAWVLGLVRQESRFNPNIRSSAGAMGLMQLMPATAKWVAKRNGMNDFKLSQTTDVPTNVTLGTAYLRHVLDGLEGNPVLAAAAYNAGPNRAQRWRAARPLEGAIYAETIPFNETRDYVKKVMSNTMYYAVLLGGDTRPLKARLGVIPPRGGDRLAAARGEPVE